MRWGKGLGLRVGKRGRVGEGGRVKCDKRVKELRVGEGIRVGKRGRVKIGKRGRNKDDSRLKGGSVKGGKRRGKG